LRRLAAALAVACLVACSDVPLTPSPTDPPDRATTTTLPSTVTTVGAAEGAEQFAACMDDRGVDIGAVPIDAQGRPRLDLAMAGIPLDSVVVVDALDDCSEHLVTGALAMEDSPVRDAVVSSLTAFAQCMRTRGVPDFPDPVAGFHGVGFPFPVDEIPYEDPDLIAAIESCRERLIPA
jgi:hypothetical protein